MKTHPAGFACLFLVLIICSGSVRAQQNTGTLTGVVVEQGTGESVIGATVLIQELNTGAATDIDGRYIIRNIPQGKYTLSVSYIGFNSVTITEVEIRSARSTEINVVMSQGNLDLDAVTVTAYRQTNTVESVIRDVRSIGQISSGISSRQIAVSQDGDAAKVMQRMPGVTIVENRFVMVRGLGERYNNVLINNVTAPSTEVDKRTFSFDLISSGSLDRMMIYKSGSADLPGDFAGGIIKVYTRDHIEADFLNISLGMGYRNGTTGRSFLQSRGSGTDFLGFDNGFRRLPPDFPDTRTLQGSPRNAQLRIDAAHMLPNNFQPGQETALTNNSLGIALGMGFNIGKVRAANITSVDYSNSYQYFERDFFRYFEWEDRSMPILQRFAYVDQNYRQDVQLSLMSNWSFRFNDRNQISFKNLFNQIGEDETIIRNGFDFIQRPDDDIRNYLLGYRSRSIYTGQLEGTHFATEQDKFNWTVGWSYLNEDEPDLRRFRTFRPDGNEAHPFVMQMPPSSNLFDTGRYYGNLNEYSFDQGGSYTRKNDGIFSELKTGYLVSWRDRSFESRYISYLYPGFFNPEVREELIRLPLDQIFAPENIRNQNGFIIEEGTRPIDSYDASSLTAAGFASSQFTFTGYTVSTGLRLEYNIQKLNSRDDFQDIVVENPQLSVLPFVNITWFTSESTQLRLGYSRTINRPEFREMAPFVFYDYKLDAGRAGNPNLVSARIDNADLRYEIYPRLGEMISIGVFFKYFENPIENKTTVTTESPQFGYINADYAVSYGAEVELRKSLIGMTQSSVLDRFSLNLNASLIFSEVELGESAVAQNSRRPLQGQSPYIVNVGVYYDDQQRGLSGSLIYNIIGPRIFSVGDVLFPTIYEMPRHSIDLTLNWKFHPSASVKFGVQDVLNAPYAFRQDSNRNDKPDSSDHTIYSFRGGQLVNTTITFTF